MIAVEICLETVQSLRAAKAAAPTRAELCALARCRRPDALARDDAVRRGPRAAGAGAAATPPAAGFVYDADEIAVVERDIEAVRGFGLAGAVVGASRPDGRLDRDVLARWLERCDGLGKTLHRAFDSRPTRSKPWKPRLSSVSTVS